MGFVETTSVRFKDDPHLTARRLRGSTFVEMKQTRKRADYTATPDFHCHRASSTRDPSRLSELRRALEIEFNAELDDSRTRIRAKNPAKVAWVDDGAGHRVKFSGADVANGIASACMVQGIEKI